MNLLTRAEFLPAFVARLKEEPEVVVKEFEAFRRSGQLRHTVSMSDPVLTKSYSLRHSD